MDLQFRLMSLHSSGETPPSSGAEDSASQNTSGGEEGAASSDGDDDDGGSGAGGGSNPSSPDAYGVSLEHMEEGVTVTLGQGPTLAWGVDEPADNDDSAPSAES